MVIPIIVRAACGFVNLPKLIRVPGFGTIILPVLKPINAINNPIPPDIAILRFDGSASTIFSRIEVTVIIINKIPEINTAAKA